MKYVKSEPGNAAARVGKWGNGSTERYYSVVQSLFSDFPSESVGSILIGIWNGSLKQLLGRVTDWPKAAQQMAIASLEKIEDEMVVIEGISPEDRAALELSAADVEQGRFASDRDADGLFRRYRQA
jgi:hypothetical protein